MSLVAYDPSDDEEQEEDCVSQTKILPEKPPTNLGLGLDIIWSKLDRNRTQPIRIPAPPLDDVREEREPLKKRVKTGKSLFDVLPKPKSDSAIIIPLSIKRKELNRKVDRIIKASSKKKEAVKKEDEDDEEVDSFFFTDHKDLVYDPVDLPEEPKPKQPQESDVEIPVEQSGEPQEIEDDPKQIEFEAIRQLCGTRDRRKNDPSSFVTIDGDALIGDNRDYIKEITNESAYGREPISSSSSSTPWSTKEKRNHQITYLARKAKANEIQLKNQWANNRMTKKQTQAKYGF